MLKDWAGKKCWRLGSIQRGLGLLEQHRGFYGIWPAITILSPYSMPGIHEHVRNPDPHLLFKCCGVNGYSDPCYKQEREWYREAKSWIVYLHPHHVTRSTGEMVPLRWKQLYCFLKVCLFVFVFVFSFVFIFMSYIHAWFWAYIKLRSYNRESILYLFFCFCLWDLFNIISDTSFFP